ncbi:MAG: hypothetical protein LWY06_08115 [Firmicutes bacterium]|nr:hypothetical protein [Bacillota bacterium]
MNDMDKPLNENVVTPEKKKKEYKYSDKGKKILSLIFFLAAIALTFVIGISVGSKEGSLLNLTGSVIGSAGSVLGVLGAFFLAKLIFPRRGKANVWGYILGIITIIIGAAGITGFAFLIGFIELPGFTFPEVNNLVITFYSCCIVWLLIMIWRGIESPAPLVFILGAILGGLLYPAATLYIPAAVSAGFVTPADAADPNLVDQIRIVLAALGAVCGGLGATAARASGFLLKWIEYK